MGDLFQNFDPWALFVQGLGMVATVLGIIVYQQKKARGIVFVQLIAHVFWTSHFFLLGGLAGGLLNLIGIFRCTVFYFRTTHKWAQSPVWYGVFGVLLIAASIFSWIQGEGPVALLPMFAMLTTTVAFSLPNPFHVRVVNFIGSPFWLIYNIINFSVPGIITELFVMTSIVIGILRIDLPRIKQTNKTE